MFSGSGAAASASQQQSQDTLFALAKDTGGKAMFDYNDLVARHRAGGPGRHRLLHRRLLQHEYGDRRQVPARAGDAHRQAPQADLSYRQGYYADKTFAKFTTADKERQLEEAFMLEDPITEITIAMELNYFQLNRAEYYVPVAMKIPGQRADAGAPARRGADARSTSSARSRTSTAFTIQNIRDKVDIKLSDDDAEQLARAADPVRDRLHAAARQIRHQGAGARRHDRPHRHVSDARSRSRTSCARDSSFPISSVVLSSQRVPLGDELFTVKQNDRSTP